MAFSKQKIIVSAKLNFARDGTQSTEVEWVNEVLEDGALLTSVTHRGAYPVDPVTGNPDQSIQTIMGIKLSKLFSNAGDNAVAGLVTANTNIATLQAAKDAAVLDLQTAKDSLASVKATLRAAKTEKQNLRQRLKDNAIADADIPIVPVDDSQINTANFAPSGQSLKL